MATHSVAIEMSPSTLQQLQQSGSRLVVLKAVSSPAPGGVPLVWFQQQPVMSPLEFAWQEEYQGFTSQQQLVAGAVIRPSFVTPMNLGQTLVVTEPSGLGMVQPNGTPGQLTIQDQVGSPFTVGHAQQIAGAPSGLVVAFTLAGPGMTVPMKPVDTVLLAFAQNVAGEGAVVTSLPSPSFLVDASASDRQVTYDANAGWSCGGCSWARTIAPGTPLASVLIKP